MQKKLNLVVCFLFSYTILLAQNITYTEPEKDDTRQLNFEIIGKISGNILIYKNIRDDHYISRYDQGMKLIERNKLDLPEKLINTDFIGYPEQAFMIYQYQKKNIVYCMAVKIDGGGKVVGEPIQMDTTQISFWASNKIYTVINSDDKKKIGVFKVNTKNEKLHFLTTTVFDENLRLLKKDRMVIAMPERHDYLTEFAIDNDGDFVFLKATNQGFDDNVYKLELNIKPLQSDVLTSHPVPLKNVYIDDVRVKTDNANKRFLITSFYSKSRRNNIDGLYSYIRDKTSAKGVVATGTLFSDDLRADVRNGTATKTAFNDFFLRNMTMRNDGGYIITAESISTLTRGGAAMNRWNYFSPYYSPYEYQSFGRYSYLYPWSGRSSLGQTTRYFADNVLVLSFDNTGKLEWSNLIRKSQYDDNSDGFLGYSMINTGANLHFLFNMQEKRALILNSQEIDADGQIKRNPTFKNLDKGYEFMPRYGKQVGAKTIIVPCQYRNYICFAKVELS